MQLLIVPGPACGHTGLGLTIPGSGMSVSKGCFAAVQIYIPVVCLACASRCRGRVTPVAAILVSLVLCAAVFNTSPPPPASLFLPSKARAP